MPTEAVVNPSAVTHLAKVYGVSIRTIYRWQADGVAVADACEVAMHLARMKNAPAAAVQAVKNILKNELETLNS